MTSLGKNPIQKIGKTVVRLFFYIVEVSIEVYYVFLRVKEVWGDILMGEVALEDLVNGAPDENFSGI